MKKRLFTPGPTPIPEKISLKMAEPLIHHRGPGFSAILREVTEGLRYLFQTQNDVLILTTSGTGGMEAAVVNFLSRGDKVLVVEGGKFGQRWSEICGIYGVRVEPIPVPWGEAVDPDEVGRRLNQNPETRAVFLTHSETSTGVVMDIERIAEVVRRYSDALIIVDGISAVGAIPLKTDQWGIDVVVTASQKGIMVPPGLALLSVSQRAWKRAESSNLPKYYFDLKKCKEALVRAETTPFTPAITLVIGLRESLRMIKETGLEALWKRHEIMARAVRAAVEAMGLEVFAKQPTNSLTTVKIPPGINGDELIDLLERRYGVIITGGQDSLKGKIFRIGHMGYIDRLDVISVISALELALADLGWEFEKGAGVAAAQRMLLKRGGEEC